MEAPTQVYQANNEDERGLVTIVDVVIAILLLSPRRRDCPRVVGAQTLVDTRCQSPMHINKTGMCDNRV